MPPTGPRHLPGQASAAPAAPRTTNARNEAFENIFGRPSGAHHLGTGSGPLHPGAHVPQPGHAAPYGYAQNRAGPPQPGGGSLYPEQPPYPPGHVYGPLLPRGAPSFPPQAAFSPPQPQQLDPYALGQGYPRGPGGYGPPPSQMGEAQLPSRRASMTPSMHSTTSSYYNETTSPPIRGASRVPSSGYPAPYPVIEPPPRQASGSRPPQPSMTGGLTPAQAYQQSTGYDHIVPSPVGSVFPHRPSPVPQQTAAHSSSSQSSLPRSSNSQHSMSSATSGASRTNPSPGPSFYGSRPSGSGRLMEDVEEERMRSPPPDYNRSMDNLSLTGAMSGGSSGPLGRIAGIPEAGEKSDLEELMSQWGTSSRSPDPQPTSQPSAVRPAESGFGASSDHGSAGTLGRASGHRRMASDASVASSGGFTMTTLQASGMTGYNPSRMSSSMHGGSSSPVSPSTPSGTDFGFDSAGAHRMSGRQSMDSTVSLPQMTSEGGLPAGAAASAFDHRATSFSGGSVSRRDVVGTMRSGSVSHVNRPPLQGMQGLPPTLSSNRSLRGALHRSQSSARAAALQSIGHIYPALLSRVALAVKQLLPVSDLTKDGITYKDSFDGRTAVSIIAEIIKTPDRNLALLLGRALDAQKFFHDVTYDHRLRDNPTEIYQFTLKLPTPFATGPQDSPASEHAVLARATSTGSAIAGGGLISTPESRPLTMSDSQGSMPPSSNATPATSTTNLTDMSGATTALSMSRVLPARTADDSAADAEEGDLPVGVFTLLTDCYSPTCSRESLCYSINCPRRLEQMKRLNMKPTGLSRKLSQEALHDDVKETGTLWIHSVSQDILDSVDDTEKKRQEAINEVIYTERDFVRDLEYLRESWVKPLLSQNVVPQSRREDFVRQLFWNVHDVLSTNKPLADALTKRQKQQPVVQRIGDIFLERVPMFEPFVVYGAHQLFGKYEFEKEKGANPEFQKFVDETERKPESRKLELNGYLTKPTTRLGRYPLLLQAVLKYTPDDSPDKRDLPKVIEMIKAYLAKVNVESGKSENVFELAQLEGQLSFRPNENIDLRLRDKNRQLVQKGPLKRRGGNRDEIADLQGFLFDHAFLLTKPKFVNKAEQLRVYRRPIPLELLVVTSPDESYNNKLSTGTARSKLMSRPSGSKTFSGTHVPPKPESKHGFSLTVTHLGKKGYTMQLWVETYVGRKKWLESIDKQQTILRDRSCIFVSESITDGYFYGLRRITCISPYDNGNRMIYGTDEGVYFSNLRDEKLREPVKVINLLDVTQVDVIEEFQLLVVLHERSVTTFPLDCLDPNDPNSALKRGKRISSHTSFFKSGQCLGKTLIAVVKSSTLSSTIKVMEPVDQTMRGKKPPGGFMKRLNGGQDSLKLFKEFYIPTESSSIHFLKTKICVACTKGFEIVDLDTLDMQGLLDPADAALDFVMKRDNVRPIAIYRIEEDFLLCYDEFAFYVNKNGWRSRPKWAIIWEGCPTAFALQYPYVIAFEPTFIEVHSVDTGHLVQIIPGNNLSCLFADTPPSQSHLPTPPSSRQHIAYPGPGGFRPPQGGNPYGAQVPPFAAPPGPQGGSGYPGPGPSRPSMPPPPGTGFHPHMPPFGAGGMLPPPAGPVPQRYVRNQVIFTSEDGHVQFLKFPPPPGRPAHSHRMST